MTLTPHHESPDGDGCRCGLFVLACSFGWGWEARDCLGRELDGFEGFDTPEDAERHLEAYSNDGNLPAHECERRP